MNEDALAVALIVIAIAGAVAVGALLWLIERDKRK
jgi:hypothetical protein